MSWQVLLLISVVFSSVSTILQKVLLKGIKNPMGFAIFFQLCTAIVIGIFAVIQGLSIPNMLPFLPNFIGSIIIYTLANICIFRSLAKIEASEFTILFVTRGVWTILAAMVFLHETFIIKESIGTALILVSVLLVTYKKKFVRFNIGTWYALGAGFLFGIGYVNDAYIVQFFHAPITYSFLDFLLPGIVLFFLFPKSVSQTAKVMFTPRKLVNLLLLCLLYAIFGVTVLLAYKAGGEASVIGAISQTSTILTVLLAILFLKERTAIVRKIAATAFAFIGVLLLG